MAVVKVSPARVAAFRVLQKIAAEKSFSAILLPQAEADLKSEDRALCHELALGVLRQQILLDRLIEHFSGKKINKLDLPVLLALRIGLYQLRFLTKVPARAAVNESVNLVYLARLRSAVNFVNAILRRAAREPQFDPSETIENPLERLSVETSHPVWLLEKWQKYLSFAAAAALARANNRAAPAAFRLTNGAGENVLRELENQNAKLAASQLVGGAWRVEGATAKLRELAANKMIYVQDEASQLVAHVCAARGDENFDAKFLDVCAAPGSKTTLISDLRLQNSDFEAEKPNSNSEKQKSLFVAGDSSIARINILRETVEKFAAEKIRIARYDATANLPFAEKTFDCVLVDAPCSGTGTIRHNPEIRWHLEPNDFARLADKQLRILSNAARCVKIGGRLIYSTCSLEPEENERVVEKFLAENADFEKAVLNLPKDLLTAENFARTFPQRDDVDGFFIAQLVRK